MVKVVCFDTLLQVLILNGLGSETDDGLERSLERLADIESPYEKKLRCKGILAGGEGHF
jgi:hypothetical protein